MNNQPPLLPRPCNHGRFIQKVKDDHQLELEVVKCRQSKGFQVLPWRWIVERTLAWISAASTTDY